MASRWSMGALCGLIVVACGLQTGGLADGGRDGANDGWGPQVCGDRRVQPPEECDDGNSDRGDGCEPDCTYTCRRDAECDDRDQCTRDTCQTSLGGRQCYHLPRTGEGCDDGNPCTDGETCAADGRCGGGTNHCNCTTTPDCAAYEDGDMCNGTLICEALVCVVDPATVVACDPGPDPCRPVSCDPVTGACLPGNASDGTPCDDEDWCTPDDACVDGVCVGSGGRCTRACEVCNSAAARCEPGPGWCVIDGECVAEDTLDPANPCQSCQPTVTASAWSPLAAGAPCDDDSFCNGRETCDGRGVCVPGTPPCDGRACAAGCEESARRCRPAAAGTECRAAAGPCDRAESCDGTAIDCPADGFADSSTVCRPSAGPCDVAEVCTGTTAACPRDGFASSSTVCRASAGACDVAESCTGTTPSCPPDRLAPPSTVCRAAAGSCDVAESCTGTTAACPPDGFASSSTVCRPSTGLCDPAETCTGTTAACPPDRAVGDGSACVSGTGVCCGGTCYDPGECCALADCGLNADACTGHSCTCGGGAVCGGAQVCCRSGPHAGQCRNSC